MHSRRPEKLHRNWPGSLLAPRNNAAARLLLMLPVDAHVINVRSSEQLSPVVRKDGHTSSLGHGTPFVASVRKGVADEKLWKENCHHDSIRYNLLIDYQASVSHIHAATIVTDP